MTYTDEFGFAPEPEFEEEEYPTAFGITFTPQVTGITLGILGVAAAVYLLFNFGIPVLENYQKLKQEEQEKQQQIAEQESQTNRSKFLQVESQLNQARVTRTQVISMFSSEQTLDTLLFDISNLASDKRIRLTSFQPKAGGATAIDDSSLGKEVNGKLKREIINVEMAGSFEGTQAFLQDLERLQPLLLVKNINFSNNPEELVGTVYIDAVRKTARVVPQPPNNLKTSFTLEAILPLSPEEIKKISSEKATEKKGGKGKQDKDKKDKK